MKPPKIFLSNDVSEKVIKFLEEQNIPVTFQENDNWLRVKVIDAGEKKECTPDTLYLKGWISCPNAMAVSKLLNVKPEVIGKLLNHLKIKVKKCQLGLFSG